MSDSYFGRQQYVIYCSQLRATPSADCNISHIAAGLSNYLILITPFGRYMFKRLPFGISSAPEHFQKRMDKELSGIEGVKCRMDDILIMGKDQAEHDKRLKQVLDRLVERKLTLNLEKCLFSQSRLQYLGQIIDSDGIRKDPSKIKAITDMAEPQNIADLRRFLGLVNHLMKFCPNLAEKTKPLRDLLKKERA